MPGVFDRMPKIQPEMQHVFPEDMLSMRCETGQIVPKRLANYALVLSDVSHRNPRAYDRREEQTVAEGIADVRRGTHASN